MKMNMNIKGLDKLIKNIQDYETDKKSEVSQIVKETAYKIQAGAKQRAAVDTGHMKRNIKVFEESETSALVGCKADDVEYALYVETGTSKTPAQPFLFPSTEDERPEYLRKLKEALGDVK